MSAAQKSGHIHGHLKPTKKLPVMRSCKCSVISIVFYASYIATCSSEQAIYM